MFPLSWALNRASVARRNVSWRRITDDFQIGTIVMFARENERRAGEYRDSAAELCRVLSIPSARSVSLRAMLEIEINSSLPGVYVRVTR